MLPGSSVLVTVLLARRMTVRHPAVLMGMTAMPLPVIVIVTVGWPGIQNVADSAGPSATALDLSGNSIAPARAPQMKSRRRQRLLQPQPSALRAFAPCPLPGFLEYVKAVTTTPAFIIENWHG